MILVTRLNNTSYYLNADLIQMVETTPDTVITLTNLTKLIVKESAETVIERVIEYKQIIIGKRPVHQDGVEWI